MEKLNKRQLFSLLEKTPRSCGVSLQTKGGTVEVSAIPHYKKKLDAPVFKGYIVQCGEKEKICPCFSSLFRTLKKFGAVKEDTVTLLSIENEFATVQEFYDGVAFRSASMKDLLKKYSGIADSFELVAPYDDRFDPEHPDGLYYLSPEDGNAAVNECYEKQIAHAKELYASLPQTQNFTVEDALKEVRGILQKAESEEEEIELVTSRATARGKDYFPLYYSLYNALTMYLDQRETVERAQSNILRRPPYLNLSDEKYEILKHYLKSIKPAFATHCTVSGSLSLVHRFYLNKETKEWLLTHETDYDLEGLEDLAFYRGDTLLFSSCTHERFHTDLLTQK